MSKVVAIMSMSLAFVLTHRVPAGWPRPNSTVHFVTDGLASAVRQAKAAGGGKSVAVYHRGARLT